jgi:hypothetical protein
LIEAIGVLPHRAVGRAPYSNKMRSIVPLTGKDKYRLEMKVESRRADGDEWARRVA